MDRREEHRPWGFYEVLSDRPDHKVKRVTVYPHQRLSLQKHRHRAEHWFVVAGRAVATLDGADRILGPGGSVDIEAGFTHRIMNAGSDDLVFVEVQTGNSFEEDDIERLEDDYGRIK
jgi:mannose-6-phosphate isomerase-like protein (cupin superfamily)